MQENGGKSAIFLHFVRKMRENGKIMEECCRLQDGGTTKKNEEKDGERTRQHDGGTTKKSEEGDEREDTVNMTA